MQSENEIFQKENVNKIFVFLIQDVAETSILPTILLKKLNV